MRYYIDCEFDGHNGPLLSMALVREDTVSIHIRTTNRATDPWVATNVEPLMNSHAADLFANDIPPNWVGDNVRQFLKGDAAPVIIADSVVDIGRFCAAISTRSDGGWASVNGLILFEVHDVACYPTELPNAIQHNAWWDAMALRAVLTRFKQESGQ